MKMTINLRKVLFFLLTLCLIGSAYAQDTAIQSQPFLPMFFVQDALPLVRL